MAGLSVVGWLGICLRAPMSEFALDGLTLTPASPAGLWPCTPLPPHAPVTPGPGSLERWVSLDQPGRSAQQSITPLPWERLSVHGKVVEHTLFLHF